jgi:hypothetical protein
MERDTVGKLSTELLQRDTQADHSVGEQMQEQLSEYEANVFECAGRGKIAHSGDFYVVVITKRERLMQNVLRHYFFPRISCPTPDYDQAVYKYTHKDDSLDLLWIVPDWQAVGDIRNNKFTLDLSYRELLQFVLDFSDGTLDKKARILNHEPLTVIAKIA